MSEQLKWLTSCSQEGNAGRSRCLTSSTRGQDAGRPGRPRPNCRCLRLRTPKVETSKPRIFASTGESPIFASQLRLLRAEMGQCRSGSFEPNRGKLIVSKACGGAGVGSWRKRMPFCNGADTGRRRKRTMQFDHDDDYSFFQELLCGPGEELTEYSCLFDSRPVHEKRLEYRRSRRALLHQLHQSHGDICQLQISNACTGRGETIDHIIPLSSNKRNKARRVPAPPGRKVPTQSIGSNHLRNLVLACTSCNNHKKHRLLPQSEIRRLLCLTQ